MFRAVKAVFLEMTGFLCSLDIEDRCTQCQVHHAIERFLLPIAFVCLLTLRTLRFLSLGVTLALMCNNITVFNQLAKT